MAKVLSYGSVVEGVAGDTPVIILHPTEIVSFFCQLLKSAGAEGADAHVRKAKARSLNSGLAELSIWENYLGTGFFNDCKDSLSLITTDVRWDNNLNKYAVLGFVDFLISLLPGYYDPNPKVLPAKTTKLQQYWNREGVSGNIQMAWYGLYAENPTENSYPILQLGDPHGLTIKTEVAYPNITLSRQRNKIVMQRKSDFLMRYEPVQGSAKLIKAPQFTVKTLGGEFFVEPQTKDLQGTPIKFSWLELGEAVKSLVRGSVMSLSELTSGDFAEDRYEWGSYAPENALRKEKQHTKDLFNLEQSSKILFDLACLFANQCVQFVMPVGISNSLEGRYLIDSSKSPIQTKSYIISSGTSAEDIEERESARLYVEKSPLKI